MRGHGHRFLPQPARVSRRSRAAQSRPRRRCRPRPYMPNISLTAPLSLHRHGPNGTADPDLTSSVSSSATTTLSTISNISSSSLPPSQTDLFNFTLTTLYLEPVSANWTGESEALRLKSPAVGFLLAFFSLVTVVGNIMVIIAVSKEIYLRTVTNFFIVSLAIADVMVGGIVMPFSISNELTDNFWVYGQAWCDLWRSIDVLASTASILNLCVISLDRYWAIIDPIAYPSKMSNSKVCVLVALVWFCSAGISFPAIAWWRAVRPVDFVEHMCIFTEDSAYLIISSVVSFYVPTFIMMFVYYKIYRAALAQTAGIKTGSKVTSDCPRGDNGELMTLRIHRGGARLQEEPASSAKGIGHAPFDRRSSDSESESHLSGVRHQAFHHHHHHPPNSHHPHSSTFITKKIRHFAISKKITKLAREQKAAKTLGFVVGVFIVCWVPFFCTNVLYAICHQNCVHAPQVLLPVFTWLGYINSGMNPIIYALSMRDFRRAFSKMIFCCPRYRHGQTKRHMYSQTNSLSTSSYSVNCGDRNLLTHTRSS